MTADEGVIRRNLKRTALLIFVGILLATSAVWTVDDIRWRAHVTWLAASGRIPDFTISDAISMIRPKSGFWLAPLIATRNPYRSITNPFTDSTEVARGEAFFMEECAGCHGADGRGREAAPALVGRPMALGNSDWAMFRTIRDGVPGTAMPAFRVADRSIWQAVAYVQTLNARAVASNETTRNVPVLDVRLPYSELAAVKWSGQDWLTFSGSYTGTRHSSLTQVSRETLPRLAPRWIHQWASPGGRTVTPLVRDGKMFVADTGRVLALDAATGQTLWQSLLSVPSDVPVCCDYVTRGVALLDDKVFVATIDARLVALSVDTGERLWETAVASDYREGYSITSAPLAYRDLVVTGAGGGDFPTRGFLAAFDAATGQERWRFMTIPGPGEPGHDSWPADAWETGGAATWLTGSYDAERDVLYWGTGNPAPDFDAQARPGDNLYSNSVVALRGTTGERLWYFQFTPGDDHDWDSVQIPVIVDRPDSGTPRQLLWANRNGFFYRLDRDTGAFLSAFPFVEQTWAKGLDDAGRPIRNPDATPTDRGALVAPSVEGATNWWPPTFDPDLGWLFVPVLESRGLFFRTEDPEPVPGRPYFGGATAQAPGAERFVGIIAIDPVKGTIEWRHRRPFHGGQTVRVGGLLSTSAGIVFASDRDLFYALDSRTGEMVWSFKAGGPIVAAPITYEVAGVQYVTVSASGSLITFSLVGWPSRVGTPDTPSTAR